MRRKNTNEKIESVHLRVEKIEKIKCESLQLALQLSACYDSEGNILLQLLKITNVVVM